MGFSLEMSATEPTELDPRSKFDVRKSAAMPEFLHPPSADRLSLNPSSNLQYCGFECPACSFQYRLSDLQEGVLLVDIFRSDSKRHALACPECATVTEFGRVDLKLFRTYED